MSPHYANENNNPFRCQLFQQWNKCTVADEKSQILAWLSSLNPQRRHPDIRTHRTCQIGDLLFWTEKYHN